MTAAFVGVDLGGSGTRIVLAEGGGTVLADASIPTATEAAVPALLDAMTAVIAGPIAGIGIGASGPVDAEGVIQNPDTLPGFTGHDLVGAVSARFGVPVLIDNDAVTAAYAEALLGAGRSHHRVLTVTLGTGVGVALLDHGRPWRTAAGAHPEAGHLTVSGDAPCYCGRRSCWEQRASRTSLQATAAGLGLDLATLADRARGDDARAVDVFSAYGAAVAEGLADLLTLLGPGVVVLGGGGAVHLELFRPALLAGLHAIRGCFELPSIEAAQLGNLAGATGAALLVAARADPGTSI